DSAYVVRQFDLWASYFLNEDRSGWPTENANLDLQSVFAWWIGPMTTPQYRVVEVAGGLIFVALATAAARRLRSVDRAVPLGFGLCVDDHPRAGHRVAYLPPFGSADCLGRRPGLDSATGRLGRPLLDGDRLGRAGFVPTRAVLPSAVRFLPDDGPAARGRAGV